MADVPPLASFPVPYTAPAQQSWGEIGRGLRENALSSFPPQAFEEMSFSRSFAGRQQIILNDPAAIHHVLVANPENYRRTASVPRLLGPVIGDGLFLADGDDWRRQRRAAAPAFVPRAMPNVAAHAARACDRLEERLRGGGSPVDLLALLQIAALEVVASALFSIDVTATAPALRAEMTRYAIGIGRPTMLDFLLPRGLPTPRSWARRRFRQQWMARVRDLIAERRAQPAPTSPNDLFDMLAASAKSQRHLTEQVATMLAAGHETTAVALFWACFVVATVAAVQDRIAVEAAPLDLGPGSAASALPSLSYTRAVIDETLRLYPPAFSIVRQARAADNAAGIAIPKRAVVLITPWVLHRHRRLWRDPDVFDPGRFLPGAPPPARFSYLPFGAGPRACIGAQFALTEAVVVLARLLRNFRLEPGDDRPVMPVATITLQPDHPPPFRVVPR